MDDLSRALEAVGRDVSYTEVQSSYGHDSFLLDVAEQPDVVRAFLLRMEGKLKHAPPHSGN